MLFILLFYLTAIILLEIFIVIKQGWYKIKISKLVKVIHTKEDLQYLRLEDFIAVVAEVLKRSGYTVKYTDACGVDGSGFKLNGIQLTEIWKHGIQQIVDVELAMNLAKCMQTNSIFRGMIITLGDFKPCTRIFCRKNVIECINGDQLLNMFKAVQHPNTMLEPAK